ncbi:MAG: 3-hydroxybutyryl-CoA dehydrogenase [candidate division Zixibacteria bacterium]|nr:3-hydroxybutyryl-CoA dehydrogenase [candidate division Zixibacteria bacterium]
MDIKNVSVIGGGTMGNGICHVFSQKGFNVNLIETKQEFLDRALAVISKNMDREIKKEKISEDDKKAALSRINGSLSLDDAKDSQLVVEAVFEKMSIKKEIFTRLDSVCPPDTILATNTSSLPITEIASFTGRPDKVMGMHFMNPVPMMKLVELIRGLATIDETFDTIRELTEKLGKTPVAVNDYPGFVANRILMPMINEAIFALHEGVASVEDIDTVMKLGMAHPMGPLTLADFIGLDVCLDIMNVLYEGFADSKYRPCPLLVKMVQAGYLGRKTGKGFYSYDK